ncbi:MAG TPA: RsmG family class I SAM-dependent methyltransferase [Candidatus Dormibacteraeota bacterium]|nr:RsmG family class I SAM-dependent methyltransferase [Candidatus Dormibacteraeota bacterium]
MTAIRNEEEIVARHFGESLFAARNLFPRENDQEAHDFSSAPALSKGSAPPSADPARGRKGAVVPAVADLGSGAGFPGLPIKLWASEISLTLIESNQKKAAFLREVARALTLTNVNIQNVRAEELNPDQTFDLVTLRAVERFTATLPTAARLVAPSGRLALLIGSSQVRETKGILPGFFWRPGIPIPGSKARILLVGMKEPR